MRGFVTAPGSSATDYKKDAGAIASAANTGGRANHRNALILLRCTQNHYEEMAACKNGL